MDEGFSPLSMVLFLVFIGLEAAFYGLGSAIQNVSEADLEKDAEEGNKKAKWLLKIVEQPKYFVYSLQAVTNVIGLILGSYVLRSWGSGLGLWIVKATGWDVKLGRTLGLILAAIVILVVLISFGIVIPKRCGAKKPQYWCYRLVPLVSAVMVPVFPFNLQNFAYGITDIRFSTYAIGSLIFMLPGTAMYTVGTAGLADKENRLLYIGIAVVLAVVVTIIGIILKKCYLKDDLEENKE